MDLKLLALNFGTSLLFLEPFFVQISNTCLAPIRLFRVVHPKPIKNQRQIYLKCLHRAPAKQRHIYIYNIRICICIHSFFQELSRHSFKNPSEQTIFLQGFQRFVAWFTDTLFLSLCFAHNWLNQQNSYNRFLMKQFDLLGNHATDVFSLQP